MSRRPRLILPGFPHHVTHRGNRRAPIFRDAADRRFYLSRLALYAERYKVRLYAFSLMTNHVHHILVPPTREAASCCFRDHHGLYADHFNDKYGVDGHLWQERFYACVLDDAHLWNAVRYVEQNPVRAELVERAEDYRWSSARAHCGLIIDPLLDPDFPPDGLIADWRTWLADELSTETLEEIRTATWKGVPYASEDFIWGLEIPFPPPGKSGMFPSGTVTTTTSPDRAACLAATGVAHGEAQGPIQLAIEIQRELPDPRYWRPLDQ